MKSFTTKNHASLESKGPVNNETATGQQNYKTYPEDCRKIAAVESHNSVGIERKENINKNRFFYECDLFRCNFVIKHTPVSQ